MDGELVRAVSRLPRLSVRALFGALVRHAPRPARGLLGDVARPPPSELAELVRSRVPRDSQRLPLRGGPVTPPPRVPAEKARRGLLPSPSSPRTATLVSVDAEA